nr:hypothetical protein [Candidatus Cloacimonadota bacterium]
MFDEKISYKIIKFFQENPQAALKIGEITQILKVGKHKRKDLMDTLFALVREQKIALQNRRYSILNETKTAKNDSNHSSYSKETTNNRNLLSGTFDATSLARNKSYAFVITDKQDVFVSSEDTLTAYHQDKVEVELRSTRNGKTFGVITRIIERARDKMVGTIQDYHGKYYLIPDNSKIHTNF